MKGIRHAISFFAIVTLITGLNSEAMGLDDLQFSDVSAFTECSQTGELLNLSFNIQNDGLEYSFGSTPPTVRIYSDADGSGTVSPGDQFIVQEILPATIPGGGLVNINQVYILPTALQTCPLLLIVEDVACQCDPLTHSIAQVPYLNAGKDIALCDGEMGQLGCGSGVDGYSYSWLAIGNADMSALSATDIANPTISATNLSNDQLVWQYVLATDKGFGSCTFLDTVDVFICPLNDSTVCEGDLFVMDLGLLNADSIVWTGPNNFTASGSLVVIQSLQSSDAGEYGAVAYLNGCVAGKYCTTLTVEFCPEPSVSIEKATNGEDADEPIGPIILVDLDGEPITWTYEVTNTGNVDLVDLEVTDDIEGAICSIPFLAPGESHTCTLTGDAGLGMYGNIGTVTGTPVDGNGDPIGDPVSDTDPSHYTGVWINVEKTADRESICLGDSVNYLLTVRMLGGAPGIQIRDIYVLDTNLPDTLRVDSPYFIGDDFNGNGWLDFVDLDSNGISDEEFKFAYTLYLTEDNINVANDFGEVWFEGPVGDIFVGEVGNTDTVEVQVFEADEVTINETSCNPVDTGTVVNIFESGNGCDSIVTIITTLLPDYDITITEFTCDPAQTGTVTETFTASNGCDSTVTTITELIEAIEVSVSETTCDPAEVGTTVETFTASTGCDSIVTTTTSLLESFEVTINATTCDPQEAGTTTETFTASSGCDSTVTTITELVEAIEVSVSETTCDPAEVGTTVETFTASTGCDSIVTTTTSLLESFEVTINATTCDPQEAGTTIETFIASNGCDSTVTTITELIEAIEVSVSETTCDPAEVGTTVETFTASTGCDSIVTTTTSLLPSIEVTINSTTCDPQEAGTTIETFTASNGCDSTVTTITELVEAIEVSVSETTCDPAEVGTTVETFTASTGCDSIVTTTTSLLPSIEVTINSTTCDPQEAGTTIETFTASNGCDSTITTITELIEAIEVSVSETTCDPAEVGTTVETFTASTGCDSIVTTTTSLLPSIEVTINSTTCDPQEAGTTIETFTASNGCDSTVTTITELVEAIEVSVSETTCDPAEVGTTVETFTASTGCDSIVTTTTSLLESFEVTINATTCDPQEAGTTTETFIASNGCDSTVTTITELIEAIEVSVSETTCDPAEVGTTVETFTASSGCDSIVTTTTTLQESFEVTIVNMICGENGTADTTVETLTSSNGCDSTITTITNFYDFPELPDTAFVECNDPINQTGDYCLPLAFNEFINGYDLLIDGELYFDLPFICDLDTAGGYDFTTVIANQTYGGNVHILLSWEVDGIELVASPFTYDTFDELAAFMQLVNPTGGWFAVGDRIEGGLQNATAIYGTLEVFSPEIGAASFVNYNLGITSEGTLIEDIPQGCHVFTVIDIVTECSEDIIVCVDCEQPPVTDTIIVNIPEDSTGIVCVDDVYDLDSFTTAGICDDGGLGVIPITDFCAEITNDNDGFEPDTICVFHCDGNICDTTIIIIIPEPPVIITDTLIVEIPEDSTGIVCVDDVYDLDDFSNATVCDNSGLDVDVSNSDLCVTITNDADGFEPDTICVVHCSGSLCDTTIIIIIPEPPVIITDTLIVEIPEDSTGIVCVDDVYDLDDFSNATVCDNNGLDVDVSNSDLCVTITNDADGFEPDTICVVHCSGALCDTTIIIIIPQPPVIITDTIIVNIPEDSTGIVCVDDVYDLNGVNSATVCDDSGLGVNVSNDDLCVTISNDADGFEPDTICVIHCNGQLCDTTIIIIIPEPPVIITDTIIVTIPENTTDEVCVDDVYDLDNVDAATVCNDGGLGVDVSDNTLCVNITNDVDGFMPDTICVIHCDGNLCDTTIIIVVVEPPVIVTDTIVVNIPEDSTDIVCVEDLIDLSGQIDDSGICNDGGLGITPASEFCILITNDSDNNTNDTICVYHCVSGVCDTTIIIVTSTPLPGFPPVAVDDEATTDVNTPVIIPILDNDFDPDNDSIVLTGIEIGPSNGTLILNPDGTITYTPTPGFSGVDSFEYVICDIPFDGCDTAWVVITIEAGFPPVAVDDEATTDINTPVTIPVLDNDFDPDNDTIVLTGVITDPVNGTVMVNPDGTITYEPDAGYSGLDSFEYVICDNPFDGCDTAWVVITIQGGFPPVAIDDADTTDVDVSVTISVLDNDFDPDNDSIVLTDIITDPVNGTVVDNGDGTVTYSPDLGYTGADSFEYVICDVPFDGCDTAWVVITIQTDDCLFPQAITPNNDGINDKYEVLCLNGQQGILFKVFNRWGNEVYYNENYQGEFDGTYQGEPLPDAAYYYIIEYNKLDTGDRTTRGGYIMIHR